MGSQPFSKDLVTIRERLEKNQYNSITRIHMRIPNTNMCILLFSLSCLIVIFTAWKSVSLSQSFSLIWSRSAHLHFLQFYLYMSCCVSCSYKKVFPSFPMKREGKKYILSQSTPYTGQAIFSCMKQARISYTTQYA